MWDGKDRRKNNRDTADLTKAITACNANLTGFNTNIDYLKLGQDEIKKDVKLHTKELKELNSKVDTLPCNGHIAKIDGLKTSVSLNSKWIYGIVITVGLSGIGAALVLWGPKLLASVNH